MNENLPFGAWLKRRRKALDLTQGDLARQAGCSIETIRKIEASALRPSRQLAVLLAAHIEVAPGEQAAFVEYARGITHSISPSQSPTPNPQPPTPNRTNLQTPPTSFIGREKEVAMARRLLLRTDVRLLNMTGPGGTGKTRLAQHVASGLLDTFASGVFFVPLASISDPNMVVPTIAQTFGLRESPGEPLLELVNSYLRDKQLLLVLDNFEQVEAATPQVAELLTSCPNLKILVTSRALLHAYGEQDFPVPPLDVPNLNLLPPLERLAEYEAIRLFIERAQAVKPDFTVTDENAQAIAHICARLDGLPLAIELAAARTRILPPQALLTRLTSRLNILTGGAQILPPRQQTLRNAISWSYDLLDPTEQAIFRQLSVFVGGCTLEAAERIVSSNVGDNVAEATLSPTLELTILDRVESLIDKSLLRQEVLDSGEPRFWLLETIREYGLEKLAENGEMEATKRCHAGFFCQMVEQAEPELQGVEQSNWLIRLEVEHDNLRADMLYCFEQGDIETAARICAALRRFWYLRAHISEGRNWLAKALANKDSLPTALHARVLHAEGLLAWSQGDYAAARARSEESLAIWREIGDKQGVANMLHNLAVVEMAEGNYDTSRTLYEEVLGMFNELGEQWSAALALANLGIIALYTGDYAQAQQSLKESLALRRELGDTQGVAQSLNNLGTVSRCLGDYDAAYSLHEESLAIFRELGDKWSMALCLANLGFVELNKREYEEATALLKDGLETFRELGVKQGIATCLNGLAGVAAQSGDTKRAALLFGAAESLLERIGVSSPLPERVERDRNVATSRAALGEQAFSTAFEEGKLMGLERAIGLAR